MKPYFLVGYNFLKFSWIRLVKCRNLSFGSIQMFGYHTTCNFSSDSRIAFGNKIVSNGCMVMQTEGAKLTIGDNVYFNDGMVISAKKSVTIGDGCLFGPNVKIYDNNHKFSASKGVSFEHTSKEVSIGAHCWVGANVVILKGCAIGDNCVIGAGCVVKENVPAGSIVTSETKLRITPIRDEE